MESKLYKAKKYRNLGFSAEESDSIVKEMNGLLANYFIYQQKLRSFQWNFKGRAYFNLSEEFKKSIDKVIKSTELIAHRIMILGHLPVFDISEYIETSQVKQVKASALNVSQMIVEVLQDFEVIYTKMIDVIDKANEINDVGTVDLIDSMVISLQEERFNYSSRLDYESFK
jgi:starvation-inducible DNA-binding protein